VLEETGGLGTQIMLESIHPEFCVIGEASNNQLALGHRGLAGMVVEIAGRAVHASMAELGVNPHISAARFVLGLRDIKHLAHPMLGPSTAALTLYSTDQTSHNVVPGRVRMYVDWRSVPPETPSGILADVQRLLADCLEQGASGRVSPRVFDLRTYTGVEATATIARPAVMLEPGSPLARSSQAALSAALHRPVEATVWRFCTDGAVCAEAGVPIIGFGPGDQGLAHTSDEHVPLAALHDAAIGMAALALKGAAHLSA
jgi:acetylornithine deacetylase/succinyl-diaminopimelate desuccinylase-like protein